MDKRQQVLRRQIATTRALGILERQARGRVRIGFLGGLHVQRVSRVRRWPVESPVYFLLDFRFDLATSASGAAKVKVKVATINRTLAVVRRILNLIRATLVGRIRQDMAIGIAITATAPEDRRPQTSPDHLERTTRTVCRIAAPLGVHGPVRDQHRLPRAGNHATPLVPGISVARARGVGVRPIERRHEKWREADSLAQYRGAISRRELPRTAS